MSFVAIVVLLAACGQEETEDPPLSEEVIMIDQNVPPTSDGRCGREDHTLDLSGVDLGNIDAETSAVAYYENVVLEAGRPQTVSCLKIWDRQTETSSVDTSRCCNRGVAK